MTTTFTTEQTISTAIDSPTISFGGTLNVVGSGTVMSAVMVDDSSQLNDPILNLSAGGTADATTVRAGSGVFVSNGGEAKNSTIEYNGIQQINYGGIATETTLTAGGAELVTSGGLSSNATILGGKGIGTTSNVTWFAQGKQIITSGGIAENSNVGSGGIVDVYENGLETGATITSSGALVVHSGGTANNLTVASGGTVVVEAGGTLSGAIVDGGGTVLVLPGGDASGFAGTGTVVTSGVFQYVPESGKNPSVDYFGSLLNAAYISNGVTDYALNGGKITNSTLAGNATISVGSGGTLSRDFISATGTEITSGGLTANLNVAGGLSIVQNDGLNQYITISNHGVESILSGGTSTCASILSGGTESISSGGLASGTTIGVGGIQFVSGSGISIDPLVQSGGVIITSTEGGVVNPTIQSGGILINLEAGTVVSGGATSLQSGLLDVNKIDGSYVISNSENFISSGHFAIANGDISGLTIANGGTLDVAPGSTIHSIELDGGMLSVSQGSQIDNVTIEIGTVGGFTDAATTDISGLLNSELRSISPETKITIVFNPGEYGASNTIYLGNNTSVIGNNSTLGAIGNFSDNALFENYDQQVTGEDWTIHNTDGSTTNVQAMAGGQLNLLTITNNSTLESSTTVQAQLPLLATQYSVGDTATPIVDSNISISGMSLIETGNSITDSTTSYGNVLRGIWFSDATNISVGNNVMIGGYSGMSLIDVSNAVIAQNVIIGSPVAIDSWSGPSNLVEENNSIWEYSTSNPSGSTGAIQLNASANGYPSDPTVNNNGTTTNDGIIGNVITGIGPATSAVAVDPLYVYGPTIEQYITEQGNIDNSLGNNTGGFYTANIESATVTDNVYAGGQGKIINADSAGGTITSSLTTADGNVSGNLVLVDGTNTPASPISQTNIDPTAVDNVILGNTTASAGAVSTWGFTGTATVEGNVVSGSNGTCGSVVAPPISVYSQPYINASSTSIDFTGTSAIEIFDSNSAGSEDVTVTLTSDFGTISADKVPDISITTVVSGHEALIIRGSESQVNNILASLNYSTNAPGGDDALEVIVNDVAGSHLTHYIPILWNSEATTASSPVLTISSGFIEAPQSGVNLTGEMLVASGGTNDISMGTTVSAAFLNGGYNTIVTGSEKGYISANAGSTDIVLSSGGDITIAGGTGTFSVNGQSTSAFDKTLIETGQASALVVGGMSSMTVVGGQGNLAYQGGSGTTFLTTAPEGSGGLTADMGSGNSTVFALSGNNFIKTNGNTDNLITFGYGNDKFVSNGNDFIQGGAGTLNLQAGGSNTSILGGSGAITVVGGQGNLTYVGGSGTTLITSATAYGGNLIALLGTGNSTVDAVSGNAFIQTKTNTTNIIDVGSGNDTVLSSGNDLIYGGSGALLVQAQSNAQDTVISGSGKIFADNVGSGSNLSIKVGNNTAEIDLSRNNAMTIAGSNATINAADNVMLGQLVFSGFDSSNQIKLGNNDYFSEDKNSIGSNNLLQATGNSDAGFISNNYINELNIGGFGNLFVLNGTNSSNGDVVVITGADTLSVWSGNNSIIANNGAALFVVSGNNTISGDNAALTLQGDGNFVNLTGQSTISDSSPWQYSTSSNPNSVQNQFTVQGGQFNLGGKDTLLQTSSSAAITLAGGNNITLNGSNDSITAYDQLYGGNDILLGGSGTDSVHLENMSDSATTINANVNAFVTATDDTGPMIGAVNTNSNEKLMFIGGSGTSNTVFAAGSNTQVTLFGGSSSNNIVSGGNAGNNSLNGGTGGSDLFRAGGNNDVLIGGAAGANTLVSAAGNETLTGAGLGNDLFSILGGGGTDLISNFTGQLVVASALTVSSETVSGGALNVYLNDGTHLIFSGLASVNQNGNIFTH